MMTKEQDEAALTEGAKVMAAHEKHRRWLARVKAGEKPAPILLGVKLDTGEDSESAANSADGEVVRCFGPTVKWAFE